MTDPDLSNELESLKAAAVAKIAAVTGSGEMENVRVELLGRKSELMIRMKGLGKLPPDQRPAMGKGLNEVRDAITAAIEEKQAAIRKKELSERLENEVFDITLPGRPVGMGRSHPVCSVMDELMEIFIGLGFMVEEGPEVETDEYNFRMLNFPDNHPARDMQDTFYLSDGARLLRTHTSPVQIHSMLKHKPPMSVIAPGRVYRCDSDVTHSPVFHQVEGFHVDRHITFGHLKGTLELFVHRLYGKDTKLRFRPSFFPFTEPSAEIDISCVLCGGDGCRLCKGTGWMEILGAGMIDPNVFEAVGIDPERWSGYAFGVGIERIAMLRYGIDDIRLLYENNTSFLKQF